jgi:hypothetical protein
VNNFRQYDEDGSGRMDFSEVKRALHDFDEQQRQAREAHLELLRQASATKFMLLAKRRSTMANAEKHAAEVMEVIYKKCGGASEISATAMRTYLEPVPRFKPFVEWMLQGKMTNWRKYDVNHSGSLDLEEIEGAVDEYLDEVAPESDEFRGVVDSERPSPPKFKGTKGNKVTPPSLLLPHYPSRPESSRWPKAGSLPDFFFGGGG